MHVLTHCLGSWEVANRDQGCRAKIIYCPALLTKFSDPWFKTVVTSGFLFGNVLAVVLAQLPVWVFCTLSWSTAGASTLPSPFSGGAGSLLCHLGAPCFLVLGAWLPDWVVLSLGPWSVLPLVAVGLVLFGLLIWVLFEAFCVFFSPDTSLVTFFFTLWRKLAQSSLKSSSDSSIIWLALRLAGGLQRCEVYLGAREGA